GADELARISADDLDSSEHGISLQLRLGDEQGRRAVPSGWSSSMESGSRNSHNSPNRKPESIPRIVRIMRRGPQAREPGCQLADGSPLWTLRPALPGLAATRE